MDLSESETMELDLEELSWLLCSLSLFTYWKLTFLLRDLDEALEDALASRFRRSESLDSLLFPEPMLFLSLMWMLQLELGPVGHEVV